MSRDSLVLPVLPLHIHILSSSTPKDTHSFEMLHLVIFLVCTYVLHRRTCSVFVDLLPSLCGSTQYRCSQPS